MKIHNRNGLIDLTNYLKGIVKGSKGSQENPNNVTGNRDTVSKKRTDRVELSHSYKDIKRVKKIVDAIPDVKMDKVNSLKRAIENGTYNVKGEEIAGGMIKSSLIDTVF